MIFYNGATGSLGQAFGPAVAALRIDGVSLRSRLEDRESLRKELQQHEAAVGGRNIALVQMAARVSVPACESDPEGAERTNVKDTLATVQDFIAWARKADASPSVVYVSSGHVYAAGSGETRIREDGAVEPRSVYARTKLAAERALSEYAREAGVPLVAARVFGLLGVRQPDNYMLPGLIRRVRQRELSAVPGLSFYRDFLDARDVCRCLIELWQRGLDAEGGVVNVCSGEPVQLRALVEQLIALIDPTRRELGEAPGRADDVPFIVGDPTLLEQTLGRPARTIPLEQTLREAVSSQPGT